MKDWSWSQYKQWISQNMQNGYQYLFRGQENPEWKLQTSFHRAIQNNPNITLEIYLHNIIPELNNILVSQGFENHLLYDPVNLNSFLAKLQHHGFPTPLLDWTYNPYIAVYFAIEKIDRNDSYGAFSLFIFDYIQWITTNFQPIDLISPNPFVSTFKPNYANNPRLITQNSILTVTNVNDIQEYLTNAERLQGKKFLYKINFLETFMKILNVGWISNIVLLIALAIVVLLSTSTSIKIPTWKIVSFGFLIPYAGAIIANQLRLYTMPDAYFTDGTVWDSFKKRFFWNHGLQLSTIFTIYFLLFYIGAHVQ